MGLVLQSMSASLGAAGTKYSDGATNQIKVIGALALTGAFNAAGTQHNGLVISASDSNPTADTKAGTFYVKTVSGNVKPYFIGAGGTATDLSSTSSSAGGSTTQVQVNTGGSLAGITNMLSDGTNVTKLVADATAEILLESSYNNSSAIKLLTNTGTSERIVITNTLGNDPAAIDINASAGGIDVDAAGAVAIDSSASTLSLGGASVAQKITVGGETGTRTEVELNAIVVDINGGATGVTIDALDAGTIAIGTSAVAEFDTSAINVGTGTTARTITVGNDASTKVDVNALAIELDSAGTIVTNSVTTTDIVATTALTLTAGASSTWSTSDGNLIIDAAGTLTLDSDGTDAVNLGTEAAAKTVTVGNAASTEVELNAIRVDINAAANGYQIDGAGNSNLSTSGTGTLTIDSAGALTMDTDGTDAINLGTEAAAKTITVGSTTSTEIELNAVLLDLNAGSNGFQIAGTGDSTLSTTGDGNGLTIGVGGATSNALILSGAAASSDGGIYLMQGGGAANGTDAIYLVRNAGTKFAMFDGGDYTASEYNESFAKGLTYMSGVFKLEGLGTTNSATNGAAIHGPSLGDGGSYIAIELTGSDGSLRFGYGGTAQSTFCGTTLIGNAAEKKLHFYDAPGSGGEYLSGDGGTLNVQGAAMNIDATGGACNIDATTTMTIKGAGVSQYGDDVGVWYFDGAGTVTADSFVAFGVVPTGAITLTAGASSTWSTSDGELVIDGAGGLTLDSDGTDAVNLGTEAVAKTIQIGNAASTEVQVDAIRVDINAAANGYQIDGAGNSNLSTSGTGTLTIDSAGALTMDTDGTDAINLGTEAAAKTITVGNAASTEVELNALLVDVNAGSNGLTMNAAGASNLTTSSGALTLTSAAALNYDGTSHVFKDAATTILTLNLASIGGVASSPSFSSNTANIGFSDHVMPGTDNTYDLGGESYRWRNIYTGDLHLANNRGNYTIVEEEEILTVRNNRTGKWYKLAMEEIDPSGRDDGMNGSAPLLAD